jgi:Ca-activated chloride channel family protein
VSFIIIVSADSALTQVTETTEGTLSVTAAGGIDRGLCPLKRTDVKAEVSGFISRVTVTQEFQNPFNEAIEAVYTFPLPNNAAVDDMTIQVGGRFVKGRIMEKAQAEKVYETAKQEGKVTALLQQQRPNIFIQSVANITPNAEIKVTISYVETLKYTDGTYEFSFPMTIGERYIPSSVSEEDAAKISPKLETRPPHTISLEVKLDAGVPVESLESKTHQIRSQQFSASQFVVRLNDENEIPNRDFVLRYKTAGVKIEDAILTHRDEKGGFFTLILQPPDKVMPADAAPKEIVFVLDTSGSMGGFPIEKAREAMNLTLNGLNPNDTFNVITFAGETRILFEDPVPATKENLAAARKLLDKVSSSGGTEMMKAVKAALEPSDAKDHVRIVCFMTDGYVGNEAEIIREVQKHPNARVFGFGIGNSVNHYLLDEISHEGRGEVEYVGMNDDGTAAARRFFERIRNPLLTDISLEFQGVQPVEMFPQEIPDLFDAKPLIVSGRYTRGGSGKIILRGKMQGQDFVREIPAEFPEQKAENDALAVLWARKKVAELTRQDYAGVQAGKMKEELQQAITGLGLEFRLLTPFTSFVAVEEQIVTDGTQTRRVEVPAAVPSAPPNTAYTVQSVASLPVNGRRFSALYSSGISATVDVTSSTDVNSTACSTFSISSTREMISDLGRGKSAQSAFSIAGGITQANESNSRPQQGLVSSNGSRPDTNTFTVDGLDANLGLAADETSISLNAGALPGLTASGGTNSLLAIDAASEIAITTLGQANAQRTAGAQINFVSRSGTNEFHGSLFETFGNEALNANDFFADSRGLERAPSRLNQFGGTIGGFFVKDKAFFFGNYEGLRLRQPAFAVSEVPGLASRQTAPADLRPLLNAFPIPNGRATANGFSEFAASYANAAANDIFGFHVDIRPIDTLSIGGRYNFAGSKTLVRGDENFSLNTLRRFKTTINSLSAWADVTPSANTVIGGRVNFSRNSLSQNFTLDDLGGADVSSALFGLPFEFLKYDLAGRNSALAIGGPAKTNVDQFQASGKFDAVKEEHIFSFGVDLRRLGLDIGAVPSERSVLFPGIDLSGVASRISEITRNSANKPVLTNFSLFAQDNWRLSSRLSLNFGLRWDADFAPRVETANSGLPNAATQMRDNVRNFAPRVNVAFDPFNNGKTVLRGGAGLYYDLGNAAASESFANSFPYAAGNFARDVNFAASPANVFNPLIVFDKNLRTPRTWQVLAEYQQKITRNDILTASYVGAFGRKLFLTRTFSGADPDLDLIRLTENSGRSDYHAAQFHYRHRLSQGMLIDARYTFARSIDNFSPDSIRRSVFVSQNLRQDRGASDLDVRHVFSIYGSYSIRTPYDSGLAEDLTKGWTVFEFINTRSALPMNVTYAAVNDYGVELFRPDLNISQPLYINSGGIRRINPLAFSLPAASTQGSLGRNALRGFSLFQMDLSVEREFNMPGEAKLQFAIRMFNLLNNKNFADMNGNLGTRFSAGNFLPDAYAGQTVSTFGSQNFTPFYLYGGARTIQFSAKFAF